MERTHGIAHHIVRPLSYSALRARVDSVTPSQGVTLDFSITFGDMSSHLPSAAF
jgi:hypothetical protein